MIFNQNSQKFIKFVWIIVGVLVAIAMVVLYSFPSLFQ
jgi:hypothetical protein